MRILSIMHRILVSYQFRYVQIMMSAVLSFLPVFYTMQEPNYLEETITSASLRSGTLFYESSVFAIAFVIPSAIDCMLDVCNSMFGNQLMIAERLKVCKERLTVAENMLLFVGFSIQPMVAFLPRTIPNLTLIWMCCRKCQIMLVFGGIAMSWCRLYPERWSPLFTSIALILCNSGNLLSLFANVFMCSASTSTMTRGINMHTASTALIFCGIGPFMLKAIVWLYQSGRQLMRISYETKEFFTSNKLPVETIIDNHNVELYYSFGYILISLVTFVIVVSVSNSTGLNSTTNHPVCGAGNGSGSPLNLTSTGLLSVNISYIIMELCILNFHIRQAKYESITNLLRLLNAKKQYVRYFSHELRTPLNSVFLGLKIVLDRLRDIANPDNEDFETLSDVYKSCLIAVNILVSDE